MNAGLMDRDELLTDEEFRELVVSMLTNNGSGEATERELEALETWARNARLSALLVDMVLEGNIVIKAMKGEQPLLGLPAHTGGAA